MKNNEDPLIEIKIILMIIAIIIMIPIAIWSNISQKKEIEERGVTGEYLIGEASREAYEEIKADIKKNVDEFKKGWEGE